MFDPDEFLGGPTEKKVNGFDPDAFLGKKPAEAKSEPAEPSAWERAKAFGGAVAKPFVDIGRSALAANDFATRALTSPRETFLGTKREGTALRASDVGLETPTSLPGTHAGMVTPGNIDLTTRPDTANADGSHSSVRSASFNFDGKETLIPTVAESGRIMSDDEAAAQYRKTGRHLGQFSSVDAANAYADKLHRQQAGEFNSSAAKAPVPGKFGATVREGMRGVNSNIPFANTAVEAAGGPPAESPEDRAAAPGAQDFGGVAGMATAGPMLGGIGGAIGEGAIARSAARAPGAVKEALKKGGKATAKATAASIIGSQFGPVGLGAAGFSVAGQSRTIARSAGVVADEGAAALARRLMATRAGQVPAGQLAPWESAAAGEAITPPVYAAEIVPPRRLNPMTREMGPIGAGGEPRGAPIDADALPVPLPLPARQLGPVVHEMPPLAPISQAERAASALESRAAAPPRDAPNPFDEITQSPEFTQAERAKFIQEMRAAHGGEISGVTDVPNGVQTATSELATVAKPGAKVTRMPSNEVINTPGPNPRRYKASDENFAKRLGMTVEDYVAMMDRRLARRAATSP